MRTAGVITCYNNEKYIQEAIDSLAPQVDELIVVDDCSSDQSPHRIAECGGRWRNLRSLRLEQNLGPSAAFNRGADLASADILVLQGGDDVSEPGRVERQTADLVRLQCEMVYSQPRIVDEEGRDLPDSAGREFFPPQSPQEELLATLFFIGNVICAPSVCIRSDAFWSYGPFDEQLDLLQDYLLWLRLSAQCSIGFSEERAVRYRKHRGNLSARQSTFDSPLNRRLAAEFGIARLRALKDYDSAVLWRLLQACNRLLPLQAPPPEDVMRWLICLQHGSTVLRTAAISQIADGTVGGRELREVADSPRGLLQEALVLADVEDLHVREELFASMRRYLDVADEE